MEKFDRRKLQNDSRRRPKIEIRGKSEKEMKKVKKNAAFITVCSE